MSVISPYHPIIMYTVNLTFLGLKMTKDLPPPKFGQVGPAIGSPVPAGPAKLWRRPRLLQNPTGCLDSSDVGEVHDLVNIPS